MTRAVVVDTNVLVSGLLTRDERAPTARIVDWILRGEFHLLLSMDLLAEYRTVLLRPAIRRRHGLSEEQVDDLLGEIAALAAFRQTLSASEAERRKDEHLRRLLSAAPEAVLVTGDERLRAGLSPGIQALTPRDFLAGKR
ncbi:MAG TPA: putative toxin-antitoxin system toxin component, PIN family [Thermoanaerobaculia bacterium]|nr:putative toxin-antitoxin system toxin component, PIN family [Thermoanaerobaculia bacterium]